MDFSVKIQAVYDLGQRFGLYVESGNNMLSVVSCLCIYQSLSEMHEMPVTYEKCLGVYCGRTVDEFGNFSTCGVSCLCGHLILLFYFIMLICFMPSLL